MQAVFFTMAEL